MNQKADKQSIFIVVCDQDKVNFQKTIENYVELSNIKEMLSTQDFSTLSLQYPSNRFQCWGFQDNESVKKWKEMKSGDLCFMYLKGKIILSAIITHKMRNSKLADVIWKPDITPFEYIFCLEDVRFLEGDMLDLNRMLGYKDSYFPRGANKVKEDKYSHFLSVNDFRESYERLYTEVIRTDSNTINNQNNNKKGIYSLDNFSNDTGMTEQEISKWVDNIERKGQIIIYGPPGTGKTFLAQRFADYLISDSNGFTEMIQFHPAYSYEDFIQGIRPMYSADGSLRYEMVPGRFISFCNKAKLTKDPCVLIIDEINRANISRVFGELMYLLEYRGKQVRLAGGDIFEIPTNVRIIGTMNTADRSIALVDHALRRRFAFIELRPNYEILRKNHNYTTFIDHLIETLMKVNNQIGNKHYEIGISFFLVDDLENKIEDIWRMEVEPFLDEYFFDQPDIALQFLWENVKRKLMQ